MGRYRNWHTQKAQDAILKAIKAFPDYQDFTAEICDALEGAAQVLIQEQDEQLKDKRAELAARPHLALGPDDNPLAEMTQEHNETIKVRLVATNTTTRW